MLLRHARTIVPAFLTAPSPLRIHTLEHRRRRKPYRKKPISPDPDNLPSAPAYTRSTIHTVSTILRSSPWDSARRQLLLLPIRWDSHLVNRTLKTHPPLDKAWLFFNWAPLHLPNFKHDQFTYTTMLDILGEAGRLASMRHLFLEMGERGIRVDAATYTSVMHWLAQNGDIEGAARAWGEMRARGCHPTVVSYTAAVKILLDHGRTEDATGVYRDMIDAGILPNCHTYTVLMEYLAGVGKFQAAKEILSEMQEAGIQPDKAACNILIHKCSRAGETSMMTQILHYMKENSIVLRRPIFLEAHESLKLSGESDHLLREVNPHLSFEGIEEKMLDSEFTSTESTTTDIDRAIILNLLERRNMVALEHLLSGLLEKEIQLDSKLISAVARANCAHRRVSGAMMAFHYCTKFRKELDRYAYISLLGLFLRENSYDKVLEVVEEMIRAGISLGTYLILILIYRLASAGLSSAAANIFSSLPMDHNTATCTAMMDAYFRVGEVDKGVEVYSTMRSQGISVSLGTYQVLLDGLNMAGRIHEAELYRKEKKRLQWEDRSGERVSAEVTLCDCIFNRDQA